MVMKRGFAGKTFKGAGSFPLPSIQGQPGRLGSPTHFRLPRRRPLAAALGEVLSLLKLPRGVSIATNRSAPLTLPCVVTGRCSGQSLMAPRGIS